MTGSQLPLLMPRSDARQNLIDSITVATAGFSHPYVHLNELAVCFGGVLMRGNRCAPRRLTTSSPPSELTAALQPHEMVVCVGSQPLGSVCGWATPQGAEDEQQRIPGVWLPVVSAAG